ncbi:MAG: histidinol-phosphate transaminase [Chloroflexota bacterium]
MFDPAELLRPHIREMPPYEPILPFEVLSEQLGLPVERLVKLDANENSYGMLPAVRLALAEMPFAHIYPDPQSRELRLALAEYHGLPVENLLAGAGADELIDLLLRAVIEPGDVILNCPPTFGMYAFDGDVNRARVINLQRDPAFTIDLPAIQAAVAQYRPKLIFLASPNNPDGSLTRSEEIEHLLDLPCLLVLDEAYIEFAAPSASWIREAPRRGNLVVLRTFSKWAGLAGLRVGYGAFPSRLMPHLWKIKQPYNVSVAAAVAARVSLQHAAELVQTGERIIAERQRLMAQLQELPWLQPYPSQANFILCRVVGLPAREIKERLARAGILVRYFDKPGLSDHIRISVGRSEDSQALMDELRKVEVLCAQR